MAKILMQKVLLGFFIYGESLEFDALMQKMRELQERVRVM